MSSTYDKAIAGDYTSKLDYGTRPKEPAVLRRMARDLTADELRSMADVKIEYERAVAEQRDQTVAYREDSSRLGNQFRKDLETEFNVEGHPMADKLYSMAYEHGHSAGLAEVANYYGEFSELLSHDVAPTLKR